MGIVMGIVRGYCDGYCDGDCDGGIGRGCCDGNAGMLLVLCGLEGGVFISVFALGYGIFVACVVRFFFCDCWAWSVSYPSHCFVGHIKERP